MNKRTNPMDVLEPIIREAAADLGLTVDEESLARTRAWLDEPVESSDE